MDSILRYAIPELGQKEIPGHVHNKRIIDYAKEAGFDWVNDDETPWCSIFINWAAKKAGLQTSNSINARSWLLTGINVDSTPEPGDIVIFQLDKYDTWKGHVGIFMGFSIDGARIYTLGGNHGKQVSITGYPKNMVLGFRRLSPVNAITVPDKILKKGDAGEDVKSLQNALKHLGLDCGTSDGIFSEMTEEAVKKLQKMKKGLKTDGVYEDQTRNYLIKIINR